MHEAEAERPSLVRGAVDRVGAVGCDANSSVLPLQSFTQAGRKFEGTAGGTVSIVGCGANSSGLLLM